MHQLRSTESMAMIIRQRREELKISQHEMADELRMHIRQYQRYEYGEFALSNCSMRIGLQICEILELDPYELIFVV